MPGILGLFLTVQLFGPLLTVNETTTFFLFHEKAEGPSRGWLARSPGAGHAGKGCSAFIGQGAHSCPLCRMSGLDPGEKRGDEAMSILALYSLCSSGFSLKRDWATHLPTRAASSTGSRIASGWSARKVEAACSDWKKRDW